MENKEKAGKKTGRAISNKLTADMISSLPTCIKVWLSEIGAIGHEQINLVSLKQSG
ncbi:hypothetical protein QL992_05505 [Microbacterium sp. APC 3898]|uniref:Mobile element protein n=1 Tax=Planococcus notacanthi TaxID=3035188 RepID=A0ABT7ZPP9_9BACL|nr:MULTISPECIES: hypothetical protein [Terrabacteria group]MDN3428637.1 hypothetical protein [Planococcus sp. APC 4016]MDN3498655.1 hypothetical protein [Microbacterium sp. APC 3898]